MKYDFDFYEQQAIMNGETSPEDIINERKRRNRMNNIKECMIGKGIILTVPQIDRTDEDGMLVVLCTETGEIKTNILLYYINDEAVLKAL